MWAPGINSHLRPLPDRISKRFGKRTVLVFISAAKQPNKKVHRTIICSFSEFFSNILSLLHACRECDWLPCWPSRGRQMSQQRWIWGIHCMQVRKQASKGSTLVLKAMADVTESSKQGLSGPTKGLMSSKIF